MSWNVPTPKPPKDARERHLQQAQHNEQFIAHMAVAFPDSFHDWKVTACFYAALHWVEVFLVTREIVVNSHHDRANYINPNAHTRPVGYTPNRRVFTPYNALEERSRTARYHGFLRFEEFNPLQKSTFAKSQQDLRQLKQELHRLGIEEAAE